ncbi:MAG TPA: SGNH/GDSL hydrolase family protein [Campylobacterales bacterium]|nr:SGNH/GDSL hydrolase family protein [Campylobacterales bacterium]
MQWYEEEVRALIKKTVENPPADGAIVFYGSSSFRLWDGLESDFADAKIINLAFGGSTLEACGYFFERIFANVSPSALFFYAGDNDIGDGKNPEQIFGYFKTLLQKFKIAYPTTPFIFISIKPSPSRWRLREKIMAVNEMVKKELQNEQNCYYVDVYNKMLDESGAPERSYFESDMLHLSKKGYALWTKILKDEFGWLYANE